MFSHLRPHCGPKSRFSLVDGGTLPQQTESWLRIDPIRPCTRPIMTAPLEFEL